MTLKNKPVDIELSAKLKNLNKLNRARITYTYKCMTDLNIY